VAGAGRLKIENLTKIPRQIMLWGNSILSTLVPAAPEGAGGNGEAGSSPALSRNCTDGTESRVQNSDNSVWMFFIRVLSSEIYILESETPPSQAARQSWR